MCVASGGDTGEKAHVSIPDYINVSGWNCGFVLAVFLAALAVRGYVLPKFNPPTMKARFSDMVLIHGFLLLSCG